MTKFGDFCKIASSYADVADFVTVYIEEAHAADGWAFNKNIVINAHRKLEDRIEAAKTLLAQKPPIPIVCDDMDDAANYAYGGLYERLFVIHRGMVAYEGGLGPLFYCVDEIEDWLGKYKQHLSTMESGEVKDDGGHFKVDIPDKSQNLAHLSKDAKWWAETLYLS